MFVYIFFFLVVLIGGACNRSSRNNRWILSVAILFWFLMGLRSVRVGSDTYGYCREFVEFSRTTLSQMIHDVQDKSEPLYLYITWCISQISNSYTVFLLFWAAFTAFSVYYVQKKEELTGNSISVSYISIFLVGLFSFFVAGIRQTFTLSIALLCWTCIKEPFSAKIWKDKNLWMFLLLVGIGYYVHNSILLFALVYPLKGILQNMKIKSWYIIPLIGLFAVGRSISFDQINVLSTMFFEDRYSGYQDKDIYDSSWSASAYIMQFILFLICFLVHKNLEKKDKSSTLLMNLALIGLFFQSMAGTIAEMARLAYYFNIFYVILLPRAINVWSHKMKSDLAYVGFVAVSMIYLFFLTSSNLPTYHFFWD